MTMYGSATRPILGRHTTRSVAPRSGLLVEVFASSP
jgi:hypothetical protein